jgi:hypothetical protein
MAEINYKEGDDPTKKNQFGVVSGVDLTSKVILNNNPLDIESINGFPPGSIADKWTFFYLFLQDRKINTDINSLEGRKNISLKLINEFNTDTKSSLWASFGSSNKYRGTQNPLTTDDIKAIQKFTSKTDPNVQIDGWVGTQTIQMFYPRSRIFTSKGNKNPSLDSLYPIIWGSKRYVISVKDAQSAKELTYPTLLYAKLYDPSLHKDKLIPDTIPKEWNSIDTVTVSSTATLENAKTTLLAQQKKSLQSQTNLTNSIIR